MRRFLSVPSIENSKSYPSKTATSCSHSIKLETCFVEILLAALENLSNLLSSIDFNIGMKSVTVV